jgi:hypothetical protein
LPLPEEPAAANGKADEKYGIEKRIREENKKAREN